MKRKVLILCTGNSCRSQMAEALINGKLSEKWEAYSAGTEPSGYVHPKALIVLSELGITHEGSSKHTTDLEINVFDVVITVCDDAAENCPVWLGQGKRHHIGFPDPAKAEGSDEEILLAFRNVRDSITEKVLPFLEYYP
jgi:arsenate reductase